MLALIRVYQYRLLRQNRFIGIEFGFAKLMPLIVAIRYSTRAELSNIFLDQSHPILITIFLMRGSGMEKIGKETQFQMGNT